MNVADEAASWDYGTASNLIKWSEMVGGGTGGAAPAGANPSPAAATPSNPSSPSSSTSPATDGGGSSSSSSSSGISAGGVVLGVFVGLVVAVAVIAALFYVMKWVTLTELGTRRYDEAAAKVVAARDKTVRGARWAHAKATGKEPPAAEGDDAAEQGKAGKNDNGEKQKANKKEEKKESNKPANRK